MSEILPDRRLERIHFHNFNRKQLARIAENCMKLVIDGRKPDLVAVSHGLIVEPRAPYKKTQGVYDGDNRLVAASLKQKRFGARPKVAESVTSDAAVDDPRSALYLGAVNHRFGHFLLEAVCRAWAWAGESDTRVPVLQWAPHESRNTLPPFVIPLLSLLPGMAERIEFLEHPRRFRTVAVPDAGFVFAHKTCTEFKRLCERMASVAGGAAVPQSDQPLYFSRSALGPAARRYLIGEMRLESLLEREGFLVVHPEQLSVREQIRLVNRHKYIVSAMGTACHLRLFSQRANTLIMLARPTFSENFVLCDALCEGETHYVNALHAPGIGIDSARIKAPPLLLDDSTVLGFLKEAGLVSSVADFDSERPSVRQYKEKWLEMARFQLDREPCEELSTAIETLSASLRA